MKHFYFTFLIMVLTCLKTEAQTTLIPYNSSWKYLDNGSNQGTAWIGSAFSDAAWPAGNGQLGYGDGDEATVVPFGPNASARYIPLTSGKPSLCQILLFTRALLLT